MPPSGPQGAAHQNVVASKVWGASCPIKVGSRSPGYVGSIGKRGNRLERGDLFELGGPPLFSLKGWNIKAQGNALGLTMSIDQSPERAKQALVTTVLRPFRACGIK